jgi:hypothetical protein
MTENKSTIWIIIIGVAILAFAYWFACVNRGLCAAGKSDKGNNVSITATSTSVATTTAMSIWQKVSEAPMVVYMDPASGEPTLDVAGDDVRALAAYAKEHNANLYITGHAAYNNTWKTAQDNSVKNAQALKDVLVSYGADANRVYITGKAYSNPVYGKDRSDVANNRAVISVK